jgi:hypothetical protein
MRRRWYSLNGSNVLPVSDGYKRHICNPKSCLTVGIGEIDHETLQVDGKVSADHGDMPSKPVTT